MNAIRTIQKVVLTIANAQRLRRDRDYADRVIERLLATLFAIDNLKGTGPIFLP